MLSSALADQLKRFRVPDIEPEALHPVYINISDGSTVRAAPSDTQKVDETSSSLSGGSSSSLQPRPSDKHVRVVAISDCHMHHERLSVPEGDILVVSGDFTNNGTVSELKTFNKWLEALPHAHKVVICGNHEGYGDIFLCSRDERRELLSGATHYLEDEGAVIRGIKFWGCPWTPTLPEFKDRTQGFYLDEGSEKLRERFAMIPDDTEYLVTHAPPKGVCDVNGKGSALLRERVEGLARLRVAQFGHVHNGYGARKIGNALYVNAAVDAYEQPFYFDLEPRD